MYKLFIVSLSAFPYVPLFSQSSLDVSTLNARTLPEHQSVLCRLSGPGYAPLAAAPFSPEQALANIGASPSPHLTPLASLPPIFTTLQKFNFSFNTSYVLVKGFEEHAGTKVKDACERIKQELIGDQSNKSGKSSSSSSSSSGSKVSRLTLLEASAAIEACIFAGIHRKLFLGLIELYKADEARTQSILHSAMSTTMEELGVRSEIICQPTSAIQHLQQAMNGPFAITPLQKLSVLDDTIRLLTQAVDTQLAATRSQQQTNESELTPGEAPSNNNDRSDVTLAADDMLPFWIYLLIKSRFQYIHANLYYLLHFQPNNPFINLQQLKVHLANLQGAIQYLDSGRLHGGPINADSFQSQATAPKRRNASTIITNSFADLNIRDSSSMGIAATASATSRTIMPTSTIGLRKSNGSSGNLHRMLEDVQSSYDTLLEHDKRMTRQSTHDDHASTASSSSSSSSHSHHQRHLSGNHAPLNSTLSSPSAPHPTSSIRTRTASVVFPSGHAPFAQAATSARGGAIHPSASNTPQLVRLNEVGASSSSSTLSTRSSHDRSDMGDFLSSLQQQDDIVTGRLAQGQTLFGTAHDPTKKSQWTPAPAQPLHASSIRRQPSNAQPNILHLDADDLPRLVVQRTTRR